MKLKQLYPRIYFLKFKNQYAATMSMIRFQEFYESPYPKIRGKYFELEQYMDAYAKAMGNFTYCSDWNGFNVPSHVLKKFIEMYGEDLRDKELAVLDKIDYLFPDGPFYLITGHDDSVIVHEVAHGLFYVNKEYKKRVLALIKTMPETFVSRFKDGLKKQGYCKQVYLDEMQAYCVDNYVHRRNQLPAMRVLSRDRKQFRKFYELFKEYYPAK